MRRRPALAVGALALAGVLAVPVPALAGSGDAGRVSGGSHGDQRWASVQRIHYGGAFDGSDGSSGVPAGWEPPVCWYVPISMAQMKDHVRDVWWVWHHQGPEGAREADEWRDNFDLHENDPGSWYVYQCRNGSDEALSWKASHDLYTFAPPSAPPRERITPEKLAQLTRARITLPRPDISVNPRGRSFVGLPTWVWITGAAAGPVTATAGLAGLSATVTARPRHVEIDPGTASGRAKLHPVNGVCQGTGTPYNGDPKAAPPCGVTYQHSTADVPGQAYHLTATVEWTVTWSGSDGSGGTLPPGRLSNTVDIPVGEVQTTVSDSR